MASALMMVGGAIVNALAFTGSNFLFSSLSKSKVDEERKRHDLALEQLAQAKQEWEQKRVHMLDFLKERMRQERASQQTFVNVDEALRAYARVTGKNIKPLPPEPKLSDFYEPSENQKIREFVWIIGETAIVGLLAYRFA